MNSLDELVGQLLVVGFDGMTAPAPILEALARRTLGGVVLFKRNISASIEDLAELNRTLAKAADDDHPPLIAVDQEGGRVARIGKPAMVLPPMLSLETKDPALISALAKEQSAQLLALGFTMNFAPVLDVHSNPENPIIGDRSFSSDPARASKLALSFFEGMRAAGLLGCGKHFPGHGNTSQDSHLDLPVVDCDRGRLLAVELVPFRDAAQRGIDALMTAHVVYPALDDVPATLSKKIATELLRNELGFEGVLFSDDLEMKALSQRMTFAESAVRSIDAGCDALLVCSRLDAWQEAHDALVKRAEADGEFRRRCEIARERFLKMRRRRPPSAAKGENLRNYFGSSS